MKVSITDSDLEIKFGTLEKILGVHGSFKIPLSCIKKASTGLPDSASLSSPKDVKMPGTHLPGVIKAGTYLTGRGKEFWYATRKKQFLVLELDDKEGQPYRRVILSVDKNSDIKNRIGSRTRPT